MHYIVICIVSLNVIICTRIEDFGHNAQSHTHFEANTSGDFECNVCLWLWVIKGRRLVAAGLIPHLLWHLDNMNQLSE